jgi:hypothetical protein
MRHVLFNLAQEGYGMIRIRRGRPVCLICVVLWVLAGDALAFQDSSGTSVRPGKTREISLSFSCVSYGGDSIALARTSFPRKKDLDKTRQIIFNIGVGKFVDHHGDLNFLTVMIDDCRYLSRTPNAGPYVFYGAIAMAGIGGVFEEGLIARPWVSCGAGIKYGVSRDFGLTVEFRCIPFYYFSRLIIPLPTVGFFVRW